MSATTSRGSTPDVSAAAGDDSDSTGGEDPSHPPAASAGVKASSGSSSSSSCTLAEPPAPTHSRGLPPPLPRSTSARPARGDGCTEGSGPGGGTSEERSNWGLFNRTTSTVREGSDAYKSLVYQCTPTQTVEFRQPLEGAGTTLMHGDFARKLSPSEEALAIYIIKHTRLFEGKRVLDVGAGLGFAGLVCATCAQPAVLELSDGDPEVCSTLRSSVQCNLASFGETQVDVKHQLWDRSEQWSERASVDIVIAADVVYLDFLHAPLLGMVSRVLRPGGVFLLFASRRNGSLEKFISQAKSFFPTVEPTTDYDADVANAIGKNAKCFPVMVRLVAADMTEELPSFVTHLCEELREKRALQDKQAKAAEKLRKQENARHRARSESLIDNRKKRLEAAREAEEAEQEERLAAEAAAAEARKLGAVAVPKASLHVHAQLKQDSCADWHLFPRQSTMSSDGACKDIVYEVGGESISIRKPVSSSGFLCGQSRKVSVSEEVLATWVVKRKKHLKRKRVLELGSGCGLAGLAVAMCTKAKHVEITDGDPNVVAMLEGNAALNSDSFNAKKVSTQQLAFGEMQDGFKPFDYILAADVLDADFSALVTTLRRLLKPSGTVVIFSSPSSSMDSFVSASKTVFDRVEVTRHYDDDVTRALHGMSCFPKMVRMQRTGAFIPRASSACATAVDQSAPSSNAGPPRPLSQLSAAAVDKDSEVADGGLQATTDTVANEDGIERSHSLLSAGECPEQRRKRRRDILVARAQKRFSAKAAGSATAPEDAEPAAEECAQTGEDDVEAADVRNAGASSKESGLPSLSCSRSNSAKSVRVASEMSPIALGASRHAADNYFVAASCSLNSSAPAARSAGAPLQGVYVSTSKLGLSCPSESASAYPSGFWTQLPKSGGVVGAHARDVAAQGSNSGGNTIAWNSGRRSSSMPPPGNGKFTAGLLELSVDGSAVAIQRCSGVSVRGKRSARGLVCEPPRAPAVCA